MSENVGPLTIVANVDDCELSAVSICISALTPHSHLARQRMLNYIISRVQGPNDALLLEPLPTSSPLQEDSDT